MPYIDQGESRPVTPPPIVPIVAVVVTAALSAWIWGALFTGMNNVWLAPLLGGALIGAALRFTGKGRVPRAGLIAISATLASGVAGYTYRHMFAIKWFDPATGAPIQPDIANAMQYLFNDLQAFLLIAMGAYIAFAIVRTIPYTSSAAGRTDA